MGVGNTHGGAPATATSTGYSRNGQTYTANVSVTLNQDSLDDVDTLAIYVAHEGSHTHDSQNAAAAITIAGYAGAKSGDFNITQHDSEMSAYAVNAYMGHALGWSGVGQRASNGTTIEIWRQGMADVDRQAVQRLLQGAPYYLDPVGTVPAGQPTSSGQLGPGLKRIP